jgi:hypothetical protein
MLKFYFIDVEIVFFFDVQANNAVTAYDNGRLHVGLQPPGGVGLGRQCGEPQSSEHGLSTSHPPQSSLQTPTRAMAPGIVDMLFSPLPYLLGRGLNEHDMNLRRHALPKNSNSNPKEGVVLNKWSRLLTQDPVSLHIRAKETLHRLNELPN